LDKDPGVGQCGRGVINLVSTLYSWGGIVVDARVIIARAPGRAECRPIGGHFSDAIVQNALLLRCATKRELPLLLSGRTQRYEVKVKSLK